MSADPQPSRAPDETSAPVAVRSRGGDLLVAILLGAVFLLLYVTTNQQWFFGDGPQLVSTFAAARPGEAQWMHFLYFRWADLARLVQGSEDVAGALLTVSNAFGAAAVATTYVAARAFGARRLPAAAAAGLLGLSPSFWFFATTVEVYPPHVFFVACCAASAGWLRGRGGIAPAIVVAAFLPFLHGTHLSSPLLFPGWVCLLALPIRREGEGQRERRRRIAAAVAIPGLVLAATLLVSTRGFSFGGATASKGLTTFLGTHRAEASPLELVRAWLLGLGMLGPLAMLGLLHTSLGRSTRLALVVGVFPSLAFVGWFGLTENGGYFLSTAPLLAVLGACVSAIGRRRALLVGALALQACLGWQAVAPPARTGDALGEAALRAEVVEGSLGRSGVLIAIQLDMRPIQARLPHVEEINIAPILGNHAKRGASPDAFLTAVLPGIREIVEASEQPVALDLGYRRYLHLAPELTPYVESFEASIRESFTVTELGRRDWPVWMLAPRR